MITIKVIFWGVIQSLFYIYNGRIKKINADYIVRQSHPVLFKIEKDQ